MREQINKVKSFGRFLNESSLPKSVRFYGYHCSDNADMVTKNNEGLHIGNDDYYQWHESILEKIKSTYPKANEYLSGYYDNDIGYGEPFTIEVGNFINKLGIKGVFISTDKPNNRWGKYCYEVYFGSKLEFEPIQDHNALDVGDENSYLFIYQNNDVYYKKRTSEKGYHR